MEKQPVGRTELCLNITKMNFKAFKEINSSP